MAGGFQSVSFLLYDDSDSDLFFFIIPVHMEWKWDSQCRKVAFLDAFALTEYIWVYFSPSFARPWKEPSGTHLIGSLEPR